MGKLPQQFTKPEETPRIYLDFNKLIRFDQIPRADLFISFKRLMNPGIMRQMLDVIIGFELGTAFVPKHGGADFFDIKAVFAIEPGQGSL